MRILLCARNSGRWLVFIIWGSLAVGTMEAQFGLITREEALDLYKLPRELGETAEGEPVEIRNPRALRPWQHVLDPLEGYLMLIEHLWVDGAGFSEGWNFGPDGQDAVPVLRLAETLSELSAGAIRCCASGPDGPPEAALLSLNCAKARERLGWRPKLPLNTALEWVWEWYEDYLQGGSDLQAVTQDQIKRYMQL